MPGPSNPYPNEPAVDTLADATHVKAQIDALFAYLTGNVDSDALKAGSVGTAELIAGAVIASKIGTLPKANVYQVVGSTIPNNGVVALTFQSERLDSDTIHDNAAPTRLTCKTAGLYLISGTVHWAGVAGGIREAAIRLNGAGNYIGYDNRDHVGVFDVVQ